MAGDDALGRRSGQECQRCIADGTTRSDWSYSGAFSSCLRGIFLVLPDLLSISSAFAGWEAQSIQRNFLCAYSARWRVDSDDRNRYLLACHSCWMAQLVGRIRLHFSHRARTVSLHGRLSDVKRFVVDRLCPLKSDLARLPIMIYQLTTNKTRLSNKLRYLVAFYAWYRRDYQCE